MEGIVGHAAQLESAVESHVCGTVVAPIVDIVADAGVHVSVERDRCPYESVDVAPAKLRERTAPEDSGTAAGGEESVGAAVIEVAGYSCEAAGIEVEESRPSCDSTGGERRVWDPDYRVDSARDTDAGARNSPAGRVDDDASDESYSSHTIGEGDYDSGSHSLGWASVSHSDGGVNDRDCSYDGDPGTRDGEMVVVALYYWAEPAEVADDSSDVVDGSASRSR